MLILEHVFILLDSDQVFDSFDVSVQLLLEMHLPGAISITSSHCLLMQLECQFQDVLPDQAGPDAIVLHLLHRETLVLKLAQVNLIIELVGAEYEIPAYIRPTSWSLDVGLAVFWINFSQLGVEFIISSI